LVGAWLIWRLAIKKQLHIDGVGFAILGLASTTLISLLLAANWVDLVGFMVASFYWIRLVLYLSLFKIAFDIKQEFLQTDFNKLLIGVGVAFAVLGLIQFVLFPDFSKYVQHGWDPHYYRVLSTFFDPNFAGLFLVFGFLIVLARLYSNQSDVAEGMSDKPQVRFSTYAALGVIGLALVLTFSRSTYLAFALAVAVFSWFCDKRLLVAMLVLGLVVFAVVPRVRDRVVGALEIDETAQLRLVDYSRTFEIIRDHPWFGVGYNTFRYAQADYGYFRDQRGVNQSSGHAGAGADKSFLFIWATGGIFSLVSLLWMLGRLGYLGNKSRQPQKALLWAVLTAVIVHAQFVNSLFYSPILAWLMITYGLHND
ncbi:MAG TPA: O-antigen ligase family protein, partial [Candidatus Saccharimonadales bacterium]